MAVESRDVLTSDGWMLQGAVCNDFAADAGHGILCNLSTCKYRFTILGTNTFFWTV